MSFFLILIVSSQFLTPGKYYSFLIIAPGSTYFEPYSYEGIQDGFGITVSDFFAVALCFALISRLAKPDDRETILNDLKPFKKHVKIFSYAWACFFVFGLFSSLFYSVNPLFSVVILFQYLKIYLLFLVTVAVLGSKDKKMVWFTVLGLLVFQILVSLFQMIGGLSSYFDNNIHSMFLVMPENSLGFIRPSGSFLHPNQFAWFLVIMNLFLLFFSKPLGITNRFREFFYLIFGVSLIPILFSQSRTVWFILFLFLMQVLVLDFRSYLRRVKVLFKKNKLAAPFRFLLLMIIILISSAFLFSRVYATVFTLADGSGLIRIKMLAEAAQSSTNSLLFGHGAKMALYAVFEYFPDGYVLYFPYVVHNAYLQLILEFGLVGLIFFFLPILFIWLDFRRRINSERIISIHKSYMFTVFFISGLLVYYLFQPHGGRLELPLLGIFLAAAVVGLGANHDKTKS